MRFGFLLRSLTAARRRRDDAFWNQGVHMKRLLIVAVTLGISNSVFAQKPDPQGTVVSPRSPTFPAPVAQKTDAGVEQLLKDYEAAFNKADAKALTALYTDDPIHLGDDNRVISGRVAIEQFNRESLADKPRLSPSALEEPG
jgi:hypothetical protein